MIMKAEIAPPWLYFWGRCGRGEGSLYAPSMWRVWIALSVARVNEPVWTA